MISNAFNAGWAGVAYKTVTYIDIHEASPRYSAIKDENGNIQGFKNIEQLSQHTVEDDCEIFNECGACGRAEFAFDMARGKRNTS